MEPVMTIQLYAREYGPPADLTTKYEKMKVMHNIKFLSM